MKKYIIGLFLGTLIFACNSNSTSNEPCCKKADCCTKCEDEKCKTTCKDSCDTHACCTNDSTHTKACEIEKSDSCCAH